MILVFHLFIVYFKQKLLMHRDTCTSQYITDQIDVCSKKVTIETSNRNSLMVTVFLENLVGTLGMGDL